jgi:[ribosomal protein S18]-alanine N-acetyltransferase
MMIERLRWWHLDDVLLIEKDLFGDEHWSAAMFWNEFANGRHYVGAFDDRVGASGVDRVGASGAADLIGYAGLAISPPSEAWVNNIAVRRDRQRHGVGRALLEYLLERARRENIGQVLLEVAADNAPAQRLYDEYGFEVIGVRRGYYQPSNTDALVMRRAQP